MDDFTIARVSLIVSLIGIIILFFYSQLQSPIIITNYSVLSEIKLNSLIELTGIITGLTYSGKHSFFFLRDLNYLIKVVKFNSLIKYSEGDCVMVIGVLKEYKKERELIARKLIKCN